MALALLAGTCLGGGAAQALDGIWTGLGLDGQWTTAANWDTAVLVPDGTATFTLTAFPTSITIMSGATTSIGAIQFLASPNYDYTITGNTNFAFTAAGVSSVQASFLTNLGSSFDISGITVAGATVGSIAGAGNYVLGAKQLTTGGNNTSTEVSGVISGTGGSLEKAGTGTMILSGNNIYTGLTTITAGTLQLGNAGASGSVAGNIVNNATLNFNRSDAYTYAGVISGGGAVNQNGTGTTTLTGTNTYTGATVVNAGTLLVNGTIQNSSGVTVNNTATLGGIGTVAPTTIASGGTLSPGNSIGTMVVAGNLTFNAGSNYAVEVSPTTSDKTVVNNATTINGGTVTVTPQTAVYTPRTYTILNSVLNPVTGTFTSLTVNGSFSPQVTNPHLTYDANNVYFVLDPASLAALLSPTASQNPRNVANGIDKVYFNGANLPVAFQNLYYLPPATLAAALTNLSGEARTGASQAGFQLMSSFLTLMLDPFIDTRAGAPGGGFGAAAGFAAERRLRPGAAAAYAAVSPKGKDAFANAAFERRWGIWASAYGGQNKTHGDPLAIGSTDTTTRTSGYATGLDYRVSRDTVLGFALSGGGTNWALGDRLGGGKSDAFQAGLYASHRFDATYFSAALAYAWHSMSTDRIVAVAGIDRLTGDFLAYNVGARFEAGHRFDMHKFGLTPYAALQAQSFRGRGYDETAIMGTSVFALSYDARTTTTTRTELGFWFDKTYWADVPVMLRSRLAWVHDRSNDPSVIAGFQALPGSSFLVTGATPPSDLLLASAGIEIKLRGGLSVGGKFDGEFGRGSRTYGGTGTLRYTW